MAYARLCLPITGRFFRQWSLHFTGHEVCCHLCSTLVHVQRMVADLMVSMTRCSPVAAKAVHHQRRRTRLATALIPDAESAPSPKPWMATGGALPTTTSFYSQLHVAGPSPHRTFKDAFRDLRFIGRLP